MGEAYSVLADPGKRALYDQGRLHQSIQAQYTANAAAAAAVHAKVKITGFVQPVLLKFQLFIFSCPCYLLLFS